MIFKKVVANDTESAATCTTWGEAIMGKLLDICHVKKKFTIAQQELEVLRDVDFSVDEGEFISIVGSSGCGKSTLLKLIVGLENATEGRIVLDGKPIRRPSSQCGMVFQEARLFPWFTVAQNIGFGIPKAVGKEERARRIETQISVVGLSDFVNARPLQLSGGMQQRVSIARALVGQPKILLLDEPFGALDAQTRINMQQEILRIWKAERTTMVLVTHDIDEAIFLGDRVIVMSDRPGVAKKIIPVTLSRPRNRTSLEFTEIRRKVYSEFFEDHESSPEYFI